MKVGEDNTLKPGSRPRSIWQPPSLDQMQALLPQYQFLAFLGRGGMGAVFKATQLSLDRLVAIKVLPGNLMNDAEDNFAARFRQEALTMAKLNHPGIVSVYESGEAGGLLYIVMEFVDGTDVARMIETEGKLAPELATTLLTQVCDALHYAHERGVIHRDIKPANLLITRHGQLKIADFGLAKHNDEALMGLTKTNVAIGTPDFLAPEAWTPGTPLDARADLYSLGVTLYQMLTGEVPRGLWKMPSVKVGVDPRFDAIIDRAMQPERKARYQSSAELRRDLEKLKAGLAEGGTPRAASGVATDLPRSARLSTSKGSLRRRLIISAVVVQIFIIGVLVILWPRLPKKDSLPLSHVISTHSPERTPATVRDAARWLVQEKAQFRVVSEGREFEVKTEQDIPAGDFQIVYLWFDRWLNGPPQPPPPEEQFEVMHAVKTLRYAFLRLPGLSDAAFAFLAGNPDLTSLSLEGGKDLTDGVLVHLSGLKKLKLFAITDARRLTGREFAGAAWLASVEHADFLNAGFDDSALRVLATCPRLKHLRVSGKNVTPDGLRALAPMRSLKELLVASCPGITEEDFTNMLPEFTRLERLDLPYAAIGDKSAATISLLTNLTTLDLLGTKITDTGLARLSVLTQLKSLNVAGTPVTAQGLADFEQAHPQCKIER